MKKGRILAAVLAGLLLLQGTVVSVQAVETQGTAEGAKASLESTSSVAGEKGSTEQTEAPETTESEKTGEEQGSTEQTEVPETTESEKTGEDPKSPENSTEPQTGTGTGSSSEETGARDPRTNGLHRPGEIDYPATRGQQATSPKEEFKLNVKIKNIKNSLKKALVSWNTSDAVSTYSVRLKKNGKWKAYRNTNKSSIKIKLNKKKTVFKVLALDGDGRVLDDSGKLTMRRPGKVSRVRAAVSSAEHLRLSWKKAAGASRYRIFFKDKSGKYRLLAEAGKNKKTVKISGRGLFRFKILPVYGRGEVCISGEAGYCSYSNGQIVSLSHQKYSYSEMVGDLQELQARYPGLLSVKRLGSTSGGRGIYDAIIGDPSAPEQLLVVAAIHAREYATTVVCMRQLEYYLDNYDRVVDGKKPSSVFSKCCVHYVMMANPDGVTIAQKGRPRWKANGRGVDLNRNFPYLHRKKGSARDGTSTGDEAGSERETKLIMKLSKRLNSSANLSVVNYHAMGNIVFGSYEGKSRFLSKRIAGMYGIARRTTGYADASGYGGTNEGNYREYLSYRLKVPSITIEIGSTPCPLPAGSYRSLFQRNRLVILREAAMLG